MTEQTNTEPAERSFAPRSGSRIFGALSAVMAAAVLAVAPASASAAVYAVHGTGGTLHVRSAPSLGAATVANLPEGTTIDIVCQTRGDQVGGSTMWDKIDSPTAGYVADWYTTTPAVNAPSPGLLDCGAAPIVINLPPPVVAPVCITPSIGFATGTYTEGLQAQVCYDHSRAGANWFHAVLNKNTPLVFADITGSGAFWDRNAYAGPGARPAPALTVWSNEYIHSPGVLDTLFQPLSKEWRYLRITVNAQGGVHQCTWFTRKIETFPSPIVTSGTEGCS